MKKGQGLSLNVIIIAAIALIVLVVLIAIFTGKLGTFNKNISDCEFKANHICTSDSSCQTSSEGEDLGDYVRTGSSTCEDVDDQARFCCVKIGS